MLEIFKSLIWAVAISLILMVSFYFSIKLKLPQLRIFKIIRSLKGSTIDEITPLKTLFLTLAGRIGVGSISGVAISIYIGGIGTIFWMWIFALISGVLGYVETMMAIKFKDKKKNIGGPSYYMAKGLGKRKLGSLYAILVIVAYLIGFIPIQANTVTKSLDMFVITNHFLIGIGLALISYLVIKGGIRKITLATSKIVPFMTMLYIFLALFVLIIHFDKIPNLIFLIVKEALHIKPFLTGFIPVLLIGVQRAIFSNESGIGLGAIAASSSYEDNGCKCGYIQTLGIYITTMLICTATAIMILLFDYQSVIIDAPNGIEITQRAFIFHFGSFGNLLLTISVILFSFSTILTGYYYIETEFKFLMGRVSTKLIVFITSLSVLFGSIISSNTIWQLIDIVVAVLSLINVSSLFKLKKEIMAYHQKYDII